MLLYTAAGKHHHTVYTSSTRRTNSNKLYLHCIQQHIQQLINAFTTHARLLHTLVSMLVDCTRVLLKYTTSRFRHSASLGCSGISTLNPSTLNPSTLNPSTLNPFNLQNHQSSAYIPQPSTLNSHPNPQPSTDIL